MSARIRLVAERLTLKRAVVDRVIRVGDHETRFLVTGERVWVPRVQRWVPRVQRWWSGWRWWSAEMSVYVMTVLLCSSRKQKNISKSKMKHCVVT